MKFQLTAVLFLVILMSCWRETSQQITAHQKGYVSKKDHRQKVNGFLILQTPYSSVVMVTCVVQPCPLSCSGMLIGTRHVLTAAHCIKDYVNNPSSLSVGVLINSTSTTRYSVDEVFVSRDKLRDNGFYYNYGVLKLAQVPGPKFRYLTVRSWEKQTLRVSAYFAGFTGDSASAQTDLLWVSRCKLGAHYSSNSYFYENGPHPRKHEIPLSSECDADTSTVGTGILISSKETTKSIIGLLSGMKEVRQQSNTWKFNMALLFTPGDVSQINDWISR